MKNFFSLLLCGAMLAGFTACETNEPSSNVTRFTVTVKANDDAKGTVMGTGRYKENKELTIKATPFDGYVFSQWNDGSIENPRKIIVTADTTFTAIFTVAPLLVGGHEAVDLGLPSGTLWATCNIGARSPRHYGSYFAWGETMEKSYYNWSLYRWCDYYYDYNTSTESLYFTKYHFITYSDEVNGNGDNLTTLQPSDDAATQIWGKDWRMPTDIEMMELVRECTFECFFEHTDTTEFFKVTSKRNGNYIYLPVSYDVTKWDLDQSTPYRAPQGYAGANGAYWSATLASSTPKEAYCLWITPNPYIPEIDCYQVMTNYRNVGLPIRPVHTPK